MRPRFTDRVVVVTGGGSGIGLAVARAFAREGARLVLAGRHLDRLQQIPDALPVVCDVTQRDQVEALFAQTLAHFGRLDILVNNAATGIVGPLEAVPFPAAQALFETNFFGTFHCCQAILPHFRRQGHGHIVNVASLAGLRGLPNAVYAASKAAVIGMSESLRLEVAAQNIHVTLVCPGRVRATDTDFFNTAQRFGDAKLSDSPSELTADAVATALLDATAKRRRLVILPFHARLLYILNKFFPHLADRILYKYVPQR